jgi:hypothetical protein
MWGVYFKRGKEEENRKGSQQAAQKGRLDPRKLVYLILNKDWTAVDLRQTLRSTRLKKETKVEAKAWDYRTNHFNHVLCDT